MRLVRVAVPVPALDALTYAVPDELPWPASGARVLVPLGTRVITGIALEAEPASDPATRPPDHSCSAAPPGRGAIKDIVDVLDDEPFLPADIVALASWVADYYACGVGEALAAAMPPRAWVESEQRAEITASGAARLPAEGGMRRRLLEALTGGNPAPVARLERHGPGVRAALGSLEREGHVVMSRPIVGSAAAFRTERIAHLTTQGLSAVTAAQQDAPFGPKQQHALSLLAGAPDGLATTALGSRGIRAATVNRLAALGLVAITRRRVERDPSGHAVGRTPAQSSPVALTGEQDAALQRLAAMAAEKRFAAAVLHGVTGSGKTEIYLRLASEVTRSGRTAIVLVPEIALTPAVAGAFRALFGARVAIQHSALSDGERHDQWHRIRGGEVDVVIGTRSAVFAPVRTLGLLIVDEEHDSAYKQEESPRYNGRDVAVMRAREAGALAVLGSATPSLETFHNAEAGRYALVTLARRVLDRPLAQVRLVDMREEYAAAGPDVIVSTALAEAIAERVARREQAIVLLNRRGFATTVFCRQCGATLECPNCSVTLTVHRAARRARCHYCNYATAIPTACLRCAGPYLEQAGFGTERVEAEIAAIVPGAHVARVDRDTIRRRGAIARMLDRFSAGEIDVLVGTQMIAKGHDFPNVTLVGVVSADVGLGLADFRAAERTFHLLTQVAGRAGRGETAGEALVQTIHPQHYSIRHACRQDYAAFYREEIAFRRSLRYPPAVALINAVVSARTPDAALGDARELVDALRWGGEAYHVVGPAPAPLSRLKGAHRAQFFMKGRQRASMRTVLQAVLRARPEIRRRTIVDVDPMSVL